MEINYEQKYNEALERAKDYFKANQRIGELEENDILSDIFPELTESEDERIRKAIHIYLDWLDGRKDYAPKGEYSIRDMIAWLEKQGEQESVDKAESIFEVGNWVVANEKKYTFLVKKGAPRYQIEDTDGDIYSFYLQPNGEEEYHLWTIEDAKDGDVLACDNGWACIFKRLNDNLFSSHCFMDSEGWFCENGGQAHVLDNSIKIHPATKEQRELLFTKLKESGHKWDADKKEIINTL